MNLTRCTDKEFDALYPMKIRKLASTHWTPVAIAKKAVDFLVTDAETKVLDLGSGAGKFCLVAANCSHGQISGVEQRENLVTLSRKLAEKMQLTHVTFIHADLKTLDFKKYDAFYFFNSFGENVNLTDTLDRENTLDADAYLDYCCYLHRKFKDAALGTRIVTYCGEGREIPESYALVKTDNKGKLKFWVKRY